MAKNKRNRRRGNGNVHPVNAPTGQMQQVSSWQLNEFVPIIAPATGYSIDEPATVQFVAGPNGYAFTITQGGSILTGLQSGSYGETTLQFAELADLWLTYRLDRVTLEFVPNNPGAGNQSSVFCVRDSGGAAVPYDITNADFIAYYSRLKDVKLGPNTRRSRMTQDYKGLLMQVTDQPYLQTVDATIGTGARQPYPDTSSSVIPYLRMAYSNTGGSISQTGFQLGIFIVKAHYTVRGRRAIPLSATIKLRMMSDKQLEEFKVALVEMERQRALVQKQQKFIK